MSCPEPTEETDCTERLSKPCTNTYNKQDYKSLLFNIFCALHRIGDIVSTALIPKKNNTGVFHYRVEGWDPITVGTDLDIQFFTTPFGQSITGIGVSYIPPAFSDSGAYSATDKLRVQLYNFTSNTAIGNALDLTTSVKIANHHDDGSEIAELPIGNVVGVRMSFLADPGDVLNEFPLDVFIYHSPKELNP